MRSYGRKIQLIRLYNTFVTGYFSHGMDTQPHLNKKWYSKFQKLICNFLKVITNKTYGEIGRPISHSELLGGFGFRNAFNLHDYLLVNRLNNVFMDSLPTDLFKLLLPCMVQNDGQLAMQPFSKTFYVSQEYRNKLFFKNKSGVYTTRMKIPDKLLKHRNNPRFRATWPYFLVDSYNNLPENVRGNLGTYSFKTESAAFFHGLCQHPFKKAHLKKRASCKRCAGPKNVVKYNQDLDIRRTVNKYKLLSITDNFFEIKSFDQMQAHRILPLLS